LHRAALPLQRARTIANGDPSSVHLAIAATLMLTSHEGIN